MRAPHEHGLSALAISALRRVRARTWIILGATVVGILGIATWAVIATLSWLLGQLPTASETRKRVADEAASQIEQAAPGLKEKVGQWLPGLVEELPTSDVGGTDIGPVPRFPGLTRNHFARSGETVEVRYAGRAAFDAVREHFVQGFTAAGYAPEVIKATPETEQHRFKAGRESFELSLQRRTGGRVEAHLKVLVQ